MVDYFLHNQYLYNIFSVECFKKLFYVLVCPTYYNAG